MDSSGLMCGDLLGDPVTGDSGLEEVIQVLLSRPGVRLERILSHGRPTPVGCWYDQPGEEWVMLARGTALLEFEDRSGVEMVAGSHLFLPARVRHRVARVSEDAVWLALHLG